MGRELAPQRRPDPRPARLDGPYRNPQSDRNLAVGQLLGEAKADQAPILGRQILDGGTQVVAALTDDDAPERSVAGVAGDQVARQATGLPLAGKLVDRHFGALALLGILVTEPLQTGIARDLEQPGLEAGVEAKIAERAVGVEEGLLDQLAGGLVGDPAVAEEADEARRMAMVERLGGAFSASGDPVVDQLLVGGAGVVHPGWVSFASHRESEVTTGKVIGNLEPFAAGRIYPDGKVRIQRRGVI